MTLGLLSACGGSDDPPATPTGLVATAGDGEVSLSWPAASGADSYNLYWSDAAAVTVAGGTKIPGVTSPYLQTGLTNGLTYYYIVTAVNGDGESGASAVASVTLKPDAPTGVAAVAGVGEMTVSWDAAAAVGATSYNVYWQTTPGVTPATGIKVEVADKAASSYVIPGLPAGVAYYAVVTAVNAGGESPVSAEVNATLAPAAPTAVSAVSGDGEVTIAWTGDVVGATSYNLYWSNTAGVTKATGTKVEGVTTPFLHTGLTNGTSYYYVVTAVGAGGEGVESQQVSAKPVVPLPNAPQNVSAIATPETTKSVTLQWTRPAVPAEPAPLTYNVYRSTTPGVVPSATTAVKLAATSPYIDLVPVGQTTYYYVVTAVDRGTEGPASAEVSATPKGPPNEGGDSAYGNNLSVPLVFADGVGITGAAITGTDYKDLATGLRPTATDITVPFPYFNPADIASLAGVDYYKQQTSSTWQASWVNGKTSLQKVEADWGDNLASASLSASQVIRVETVLRQYKGGSSWADTQSMVGYPMTLLFGEGKTEMQGTPGAAVDATERRVYTVTARLTIQKIDADGNVDTATTQACGFDTRNSIAEGLNMADGGRLSKYSAEINVGGSQTYGFNWRINSCTAPNKTGKWRFTFSLDDSARIGSTEVLNNTLIESKHPSDTAATLDASGKTYSIEATVN